MTLQALSRDGMVNHLVRGFHLAQSLFQQITLGRVTGQRESQSISFGPRHACLGRVAARGVWPG